MIENKAITRHGADRRVTGQRVAESQMKQTDPEVKVTSRREARQMKGRVAYITLSQNLAFKARNTQGNVIAESYDGRALARWLKDLGVKRVVTK